MSTEAFSVGQNGQTLTAFYDGRTRHVTYQNHTYTNLDRLLADLHISSEDPEYLLAVCKIINFLLKGEEFFVIDSPSDFQDLYRKKFKNPSGDGSAPFTAVHFGERDVSLVNLPKLESDEIVFFAADHTGVPYKVTVSLDPNDDVLYQLLPHVP